MKTSIWVTYSYGAHSLSYNKTIDLPFVPFIGLTIITNDDKEYSVTLENGDDGGKNTRIAYNLEKQEFEIDVTVSWKFPPSRGTIMGIADRFSDWDKNNNTDINGFMDTIEIFRSKMVP